MMIRFRDSVRRHPFRFIVAIVASLFIGFILWIYVSLWSSGVRFGPGEYVSLSSASELRARGFFEQGAEWPGSVVHLHPRDGDHLLERHWLGWREVAIPVEESFDGETFGFDTASYMYGTGEYVQRRIADLIGLGLTIGLFLVIYRLWVRRGLELNGARE